MCVRIASWLVFSFVMVLRSFAADWSEEQIASLPSEEKAVRLFNGQDFHGWEGHIDQYFSIENGVIVGKNTDMNAPKSSTYLLTKKRFRNFRLIFESKLVTSEMHSGISFSWQRGDRFRNDPAESGQIDISLHLACVAERAGCHQNRILQLKAIEFHIKTRHEAIPERSDAPPNVYYQLSSKALSYGARG